MKALGELAVLFTALDLVPAVPALAATYLGWAWQAVALAALWAGCWYLWLWARTQKEDE